MGVVIDINASNIFSKTKQEETPVQKDNIGVPECMDMFEIAARFLKTKQQFAVEFLDAYNRTTEGIDMVEGGMDIDELCRFIGSGDIDSEGDECLPERYRIVKQTDTDGNVYELSVINPYNMKNIILESMHSKFLNVRFGLVLLKETPDHNLFARTITNGWKPIGWEEFYRHTYRQHEILKESTTKAYALGEILAKTSISDEKMDELFRKYDALFRLYESIPCGELYYSADKEAFFLIPSYPDTGYAVTCKGETFILAQYIPGEYVNALKCEYSEPAPIPEDCEAPAAVPRDFYREVGEITEENAQRTFYELYKSEGKNVTILLKNKKSVTLDYGVNAILCIGYFAKDYGLSEEDVTAIKEVMAYLYKN